MLFYSDQANKNGCDATPRHDNLYIGSSGNLIDEFLYYMGGCIFY